MSEFIEFTVLGIAIGAGYAILATGLVVTYNTSGVFNFAHGAVAMIASFGYWELQVHHVNEIVRLLLILVIGAPVAGALVERIFMRRLFGATTERPVMVTLGLLALLLGTGNLIWGLGTLRTVAPLKAGTFPLFGVNLQWQNLVVLVAGALVLVGLLIFFRYFRLGIGMRAVVDNPELVAISGVSPARMSRSGWMLGFFLAALAGILIAPTLGSTFNVPNMSLLVVNGYAAAVVGRMRNIVWTYVGALALGLVLTYYSGYVPQHLPSGIGADIQAALPMGFLLLALIAVPSMGLQAVGKLAPRRCPRVPGRWSSLGAAVVFVGVVGILGLTMQGTFLTIGLSGLGPVLGDTMVFGIVALSLVLLVGYASQISLCQFTFMGVGAFCAGKVAGGSSPLGVLVAAIACAAIGAIVALPTLRLRGLYLVLATFAFADAMQYGVFTDVRVFGPSGLQAGRFSLFGISFVGDRAELMMLTVAFAVCAIVVVTIRRGIFGRRLIALQDSPAACATLGLSPATLKVIVFSIAAGMAGLGGALFVSLQGSAAVSNFTIFLGVMFLLFVVIWGARNVTGAFLGALTYAIFTTLPHLLKVEGLFAGIGVVLIARAPNGILGLDFLAEHLHLPWRRPSDKPGTAESEPTAESVPLAS